MRSWSKNLCVVRLHWDTVVFRKVAGLHSEVRILSRSSDSFAAMMPYILLDLHPEFLEGFRGILGFWDTLKIAAHETPSPLCPWFFFWKNLYGVYGSPQHPCYSWPLPRLPMPRYEQLSGHLLKKAAADRWIVGEMGFDPSISLDNLKHFKMIWLIL